METPIDLTEISADYEELISEQLVADIRVTDTAVPASAAPPSAPPLIDLSHLAWPKGYMTGRFVTSAFKHIKTAIQTHRTRCSLVPFYPPTGTNCKSKTKSIVQKMREEWEQHQDILDHILGGYPLNLHKVKIIKEDGYWKLSVVISWGENLSDPADWVRSYRGRTTRMPNDQELMELLKTQAKTEAWPLGYLQKVWVPAVLQVIEDAVKRSKTTCRLFVTHPTKPRSRVNLQHYTQDQITVIAVSLQAHEETIRGIVPGYRLSALKVDEHGLYYDFVGDEPSYPDAGKHLWKAESKSKRCSIM